MSYTRTPQHRALRADLIRRWKPWEKSTGPKTSAGKEKAAKRGFKGAVRPLMRELAKALREHNATLLIGAGKAVSDV